jgi:hypothetical protein
LFCVLHPETSLAKLAQKDQVSTYWSILLFLVDWHGALALFEILGPQYLFYLDRLLVCFKALVSQKCHSQIR